MSKRYGLRDEQWEKIEKMLPERKGMVGVTAKDNRSVCQSGTVSLPRLGYRGGTCQRDLEIFESCILVSVAGPRQVLVKTGKGVWEEIFKVLSAATDNEYIMIDSTIVRAHQHSSGAKAQ